MGWDKERRSRSFLNETPLDPIWEVELKGDNGHYTVRVRASTRDAAISAAVQRHLRSPQDGLADFARKLE